MAVVGTLSMNLFANAAGFTSGLKTAANGVSAFQAKVAGIGSSIGGQLTAALGIGSAAGLVGWGVKLAADAETAQASFTILSGSAEKARDILAQIKQFSQTSPLSQQTLRDSATMMLQFGVGAESILPTLKQLGDLSLGNGDRMRSLALAFGQMTTAGRLMGQDLLQMINAGFNPLQEISRRTGESMADLKKRMEDGAVSSAEVAAAFESATAAGGRFHGMLASRMGTTQGQFDKLTAAVANLAQSFGQVLLPAAQNLIDTVTPLVQWLGSLEDSTRTNIVQFGAFALGAGAAIVVIAKLVSAVGTIVAAYRAMAIGQAIVHALSGPKGWAMLAVSAVAAGVAIAGVAKMFEGVERHSTAATAKSKEAVNELNKLAKISPPSNAKQAAEDMKAAEEKAKELQKLRDDMQRRGADVTQQFRTPGEEFRDTAAEMQNLLSAGAISGETFRRAMTDARKKAAEARGDFEAIEAAQRGLGAARQGTFEGFSAVQQALRDSRAAREKNEALRGGGPAAGGGDALERESLAEARRTNELLAALIRAGEEAPEEEFEYDFTVANF